MTYTPQYPGGWKDLPDTSTPVTAAALGKIDAALLADDASIAANAANIAAVLATATTHTGQIAANSAAITALQGTVGGMLAKVAATALAGYTFVNGTGNILTWAVPNDGAMHRVMVLGEVRVITAQTGGAVTLTFTYPDGSASPAASVYAGGTGAGFHGLANTVFLAAPGTTVTLAQSSAQTGGSGSFWAELWAS